MSFNPERRKFLKQMGAVAINTLVLTKVPAIAWVQEAPSVYPYIVYPSDKISIPEYESALIPALQEVQSWFGEQIGKTFEISPLQIKISKRDHLTIRCGSNPDDECLSNSDKTYSGTWMEAIRAVTGDTGDSIVLYKNRVISACLAGSGGMSQGGSFSSNAGYAVLGDWYLEAFSGKSNEWGINCSYNPFGEVGGWICDPEKAKLGIAHELGHAFGLRHPEETSKQSLERTIMSGDLEANRFSSEEVEFLQTSPFLR